MLSNLSREKTRAEDSEDDQEDDENAYYMDESDNQGDFGADIEAENETDDDD